MQLLNVDSSEDILVCVTKCTELLCKQISCDQGTEDDTQPLVWFSLSDICSL